MKKYRESEGAIRIIHTKLKTNRESKRGSDREENYIEKYTVRKIET